MSLRMRFGYYKRTPSLCRQMGSFGTLVELIIEKTCGCCLTSFNQVSSNPTDVDSGGKNDLLRKEETTKVGKQTIDQRILQSPPHDQGPKVASDAGVIDPPSIARSNEARWIFIWETLPTTPSQSSLIHSSKKLSTSEA